MTHVSTPIFLGLFKNIVFRSVALVIKKLWAIFFYTLQTIYRPVPYPLRKKKNYKKILQITIYEKSKYFTVIVSQMRVLGQKNYRGGRQTPPPPAFIGLIYFLVFLTLGAVCMVKCLRS